MATASQSITEELLKLFLNNDPGLADSGFSFEGEVEEETHDGKVLNGSHPVDTELLLKTGQDFRQSGDEFNNIYMRTHKKSLHTEVKEFFEKEIFKAKDPEKLWPKFQGIFDNALRDNYLNDKVTALAAVYVSVKGLSYLGSSVTDFTLRYIREMNLDAALNAIAERRHTNLD